MPIPFKTIILFSIALFVGSTSFAQDCNFAIPGHITNRYVENNDGTIYDSFTGLTWFRCNIGQSWDNENNRCIGFATSLNWKEMLVHIEEYNNEQFSQDHPFDWRLPNIKELASIVSVNCRNPAMDTSIFPDIKSVYWSSTPYALDVSSTAVLDENDPEIIDHYIDKNTVWTIQTLTGKENWTEAWDAFSHSALIVRGQSAK